MTPIGSDGGGERTPKKGSGPTPVTAVTAGPPPFPPHARVGALPPSPHLASLGDAGTYWSGGKGGSVGPLRCPSGILGYGAILRLPARSPRRYSSHPSSLAAPAWRPPAVNWSRPVVSRPRSVRPASGAAPAPRALAPQPSPLRAPSPALPASSPPRSCPGVPPALPLTLRAGRRCASVLRRIGRVRPSVLPRPTRPAASRRRRAPPMVAAPMPASGQAPPPTAGFACGRAAATPAVGRWVRGLSGSPSRPIRCSRACGLAPNAVRCEHSPHLPAFTVLVPASPCANGCACRTGKTSPAPSPAPSPCPIKAAKSRRKPFGGKKRPPDQPTPLNGLQRPLSRFYRVPKALPKRHTRGPPSLWSAAPVSHCRRRQRVKGFAAPEGAVAAVSGGDP